MMAINIAMNKPVAVVAVIVTCLVLSSTCVGMRFYVRLSLVKKFGLDDWAAGIAQLCYISAAIVAVVSTSYGLGDHYYYRTVSDRTTFLILLFVSSAIYGVVIMLIKTAFLLQFKRVFPLPIFQRLCNIFLVIIGLWTLMLFVGGVTICLPVPLNWDPVRWKDCPAKYPFWLANGVLHIVTDVLILVMPLPLLKSLPLRKIPKAILMGIFCLGFFTCAISMIRITTLKNSLFTDDPTYVMATTVLWSTSEVACAMICLCIPTLRPLILPLSLFRFSPRSLHDIEAPEDPPARLDRWHPIASLTDLFSRSRGIRTASSGGDVPRNCGGSADSYQLRSPEAIHFDISKARRHDIRK